MIWPGIGLLLGAPEVVQACQSSHLDRWDRCAQIPDAVEYLTVVTSTSTDLAVNVGQASETNKARPITPILSTTATSGKP